MTLKGCGKFGPKVNAAFQISSPKIGQFASSWRKVYKFQILVVSFVWKVHYLNQNLSEEFYLVTLKGFETFGPKLNSLFQISPRNINQFVLRCQKGYKFQILVVSFFWKVHSLNQNLSQELYVVTLKDFKTFGPKLSSLVQIRPRSIGQFVLRCRKGYKFQVLVVSFVWKVHYLNHKLSQEFYLVTLKGFGTFGPKLKSTFQISPTKIGQFVSSCWKRYKI